MRTKVASDMFSDLKEPLHIYVCGLGFQLYICINDAVTTRFITIYKNKTRT